MRRFGVVAEFALEVLVEVANAAGKITARRPKSVVFDMSDNQPPAFGSTTGQGEWGLFQQFLKHPTDVSGIQKKLEAAAAKAYK